MQIPVATGQARGKRRLSGTVGQWAAAVALAMLVLTGLGIETSAEGVTKQPDQGLAFEGKCKAGGGIYTETTEGGGNAWCQYEDGGQVVCDLDGNDCYHIESQPQEPTGPHVGPVDERAPVENPTDSAPGQVYDVVPIWTLAENDAGTEAPLLAVDDTQTAPPVDAPLVAESEVAAPVEAPAEVVETPAEEPIPATASEVVAIPAEEPIPVEASAEQP